MLCQYLYISTAVGLSREDVEGILSGSAQNNPARGVTGLLLYNGRNFLQLLEGEQAELVTLMSRIGKDPRHSGVSILHSSAIDQRTCPYWSMKRVTIAESVDLRRQHLERDLPPGLDEAVRTMILNFAMLN